MKQGSFIDKSIKVVTTGAPYHGLMYVLRAFEASTGTAAFVYKAPVTQAMGVLLGCDQVDLVVLPRPAMKKARDGRLVPEDEPFVDLGGSRVGLFIGPTWEGPIPNIWDPKDVKDALEASDSIGITDPKLGSGGRIAMKVLEALGLDDLTRRKIILFPSGTETFEAASKGQVTVALGLNCEGLATSGLELAGSLPSEMNEVTQYTAALSSTAYVQNILLVRQLLGLLKRSRKTFVAHGLDEEPDQ